LRRQLPDRREGVAGGQRPVPNEALERFGDSGGRTTSWPIL
jgi:hypothetical protein